MVLLNISLLAITPYVVLKIASNCFGARQVHTNYGRNTTSLQGISAKESIIRELVGSESGSREFVS